MPTVHGVLETALFVEDLKRSTQFYQAIFGFETLGCNERICAMSVVGRQVLLLCKKGASVKPTVTSGGIVPPCDSTGASHLAFSISVSDVEAWEKWLGECGVPIESKVVGDGGSPRLYFRDPDQHVLELVTPGNWAIY